MLAEDEGNFPGSASEPSADFRLHQRAHASAAIFWNGACNWLQGRDERGGFPTTIGDETAPDGGFDPAWRSTDATTAEQRRLLGPATAAGRGQMTDAALVAPVGVKEMLMISGRGGGRR